MLDKPAAREILTEVEAALRKGLSPGFQQIVAANAVALALREAAYAETLGAGEAARLGRLLGREGDLQTLNRLLAGAIRDGSIDLNSDALARCLILATVEKMTVDQPNYPPFRAFEATWAGKQGAG
jgi:hypothetical protein